MLLLILAACAKQSLIWASVCRGEWELKTRRPMMSPAALVRAGWGMDGRDPSTDHFPFSKIGFFKG